MPRICSDRTRTNVDPLGGHSERYADRALLMDAIKVLAAQQRAVVVVRHWEELSTRETAAALGMSVGTVKSTLHRALARLRVEVECRDCTSTC